MKKMTVIIYDGGFKTAAPALPSIANQTILKDIKVIWLDLYDKIFPEVYKYDFIEKVALKLPRRIQEMSFCYNKGLEMAEGKYFTLLDPCLWIPVDCLENIYNYHEEHPNSFTWNWEERGKRTGNADILTKKYYSNIDHIKTDIKKIKKGNKGCMSTHPIEHLRGVDGYDIVGRPVTNHEYLCRTRINNKYGINEHPMEQMVYHPFHERGSKTEKELMRKMIEEYKNKKIIKPKRFNYNI